MRVMDKENCSYDFPNCNNIGGNNFGQAVFIGEILIQIAIILIKIKDAILLQKKSSG